VIEVRVASSSKTVGRVNNHIELFLSTWPFMILAHCVDALSQDQ
jgi:hypothetical protein